MVIDMKEGKEYPLFRNAVLYSELEDKLKALTEKYPSNMRVEKMGKSHKGRDLFLVILAEDVTDEGIRAYEDFRKKVLREPRQVLESLESGADYKIPLFFNGNLHGTETTGTDGLINFIEEVLGEGKAEALKDAFIAISVCENPDGRSKGYDILNGNGADLNRDFGAQSQPETRALVSRAIVRFVPSVMVDFHGFMASGNVLIDTCTPPHNPNTEYDLLEEHLHKNAQKMAGVIYDRLRLNTDIPALIWEDGWEDYSPVYTPTFCQNYGCIAHTLETTYPNDEGLTVVTCAAVGALNYALENKKLLLKNQCTYLARGIENTSKAIKAPKYYVIPFARETQKDRETASDTVTKLLRCGIRVYKGSKSGDYVIPTEQALRGLINGFLWQGEDITDRIKNMYDVSFHSEPVMRGFDISSCDELKAGEELVEIDKAEAPSGTLTKSAEKPYLRFSSCKNSSVGLANLIMDSGAELLRAEEDCAGDFFFRNSGDYKLIEDFLKNHDLTVEPAELPIKAHRLRKQAALIVADSAGAYEALSDWGFDVTLLPFSDLNRGYEIHPEAYDVLIFGGTRMGIWSDPYDEDMGVGYGTTWALRERGRTELIRAAREFKNIVMFGYAGQMLNEALGLIDQSAAKAEGGTAEENLTDWHLNTGNGSFRLRLDKNDPLCYGFSDEESVYLVGPVPLAISKDAKTAGYFADSTFINGWCKERENLNGKPALLYKKDEEGTKILMGIDPCYRRYVDATYRLMANAMYLIGI